MMSMGGCLNISTCMFRALNTGRGGGSQKNVGRVDFLDQGK